jgi:hypothetical protein
VQNQELGTHSWPAENPRKWPITILTGTITMEVEEFGLACIVAGQELSQGTGHCFIKKGFWN